MVERKALLFCTILHRSLVRELPACLLQIQKPMRASNAEVLTLDMELKIVYIES